MVNGNAVVSSTGGSVFCDDFYSDNEKMPLYELSDLVDVGDSMEICVKALWRAGKYRKTRGTWEDTKDGPVRPQPEVCIDYIIKFHTRVTFFVKDIYNSVPVEGTKIIFTLGDGTRVFKNITDAITDAQGIVDIGIVLDDDQIPAGTKSLDLNITDIVPKGSAESKNSDFFLCETKPTEGVPCDPSQRIMIPLTEALSVDHINIFSQEYFIVDQTAVKVQGKIFFPSPDPKDDTQCGIDEAVVFAIDGRTNEVIANTTSNHMGEFEFAVTKQTLLKFEIDYHNHTFSGSGLNQASFDLLSEDGFLVSEAVLDIQIEDTTMQDITVRSAVTDCGFGIGEFVLSLSVPSCPLAETYKVDSNGDDVVTVNVPAHVYQYDLDFEGFGGDGSSRVDSATVKNRFEHMFPVRQLNTTEGPDGIDFIFHPVVEIEMNVENGNHPPDTFRDSACSNSVTGEAPFDFALEANAMVDLMFQFHQKYTGSDGETGTCEQLPDGFTLKVLPSMGQDIDPCDANQGGCLVNVTRQEYQVNILGVTFFSEKNNTLLTLIISGPFHLPSLSIDLGN